MDDSAVDPVLRALLALLVLASASQMDAAQTARRAFRLPDREIPIPGGSGDNAAIGDVDGDGDLEIFVSADQVFGWHHDGTPLPGFPIGSRGLLVLADLDGDPAHDLEVLYGGWSLAFGYVAAYHHTDSDGIPGADPVSGWPAIVTAPFPIAASSFPSVEDVDGDGEAEVAFSVELHDFPRAHAQVHLLDAHGAEKPGGWPVLVTEHSFRYSAAALGDLDGDGARDVVTKAIFTPALATPDHVHAWSAAGVPVGGFPAVHSLGPGPHNQASPVLGDVTGDGRLDVVTSVKGWIVALDSMGAELFRLDAGTGRPMTPALADLDDDGDLEVVVGIDRQGKWFDVVVLDGDGALLARTPALAGRVHPSLSALVGDLDGDGAQELVVPVHGNAPGMPSRIQVFDHDGTWRPDLTMVLPQDPQMSRCVRIGDLEGDGDVEVVTNGTSHVYVWDFSGAPDDCDWPMFQHDPHLSGRLGD